MKAGEVGLIRPEEKLGITVRDVWRLLVRSIQPRIAREGVTIGMLFLLRVLWDEEGLSQSELANRVGINGATTVTALNAMERAGLVVRVPNEEDRRKTNIYLTERGRTLKTELWPAILEVNGIGLQGFSENEAQQLLQFLFRIRRNLEKDVS